LLNLFFLLRNIFEACHDPLCFVKAFELRLLIAASQPRAEALKDNAIEWEKLSSMAEKDGIPEAQFLKGILLTSTFDIRHDKADDASDAVGAGAAVVDDHMIIDFYSPSRFGQGMALLYAAAVKGHVGASMALGYRHYKGYGVPKSCDTAALYYDEVKKLQFFLILLGCS
jgi:hypothetical protein